MILSRRLRALNDLVDIFGIDHFGLAGQFFVDCVSERFVFVENRDNSFGIFTDRDLGIPQGIVWAVGLDLINDLVELDGQVLGKQPGILAGQNEIQIFGFEQRPVSIVRSARGHRKAAIKIFTELGQVLIASFERRELA